MSTDTTAAAPHCRLCDAVLARTFVDLGMSPPCEDFLTADRLDTVERFYPLNVRICSQCLLVQLPAYVDPEDVFVEYAYFSSFSDSWVEHAKRYAETMTGKLGLGPESLVVEAASNDGYLLQHFVAAGIPVAGIEPAENIAIAAREKGVPTETFFLGEESGAEFAARHGRADLVAANNVYAHVPDLVGFTRGLRELVADDGWVTIEVQYLRRLIERNQYDTIYHEHFQYYTVLTIARALRSGGLELVDVEELPTHGGSIRAYARPAAVAGEPSAEVVRLLAEEAALGLDTVDGHMGFAADVARIRNDVLDFLITASREGKTVAGYGAPGKGNTLLNHCGVRSDLLPYTVDRNPYKHGRFLPGTHIPVHSPEKLAETKPDYVFVLPWNLRAEITEQLAYVRDWGAKLVFPIPSLEVV
ncbi:class I SAM-dependent methyltransferase [Planctomonas sp. JC2975]|uniref:class I SAM-dependent methyltransferase n=1 Tax=Planctomonas sp. JC2975 TaxID=2729626 RepID=UPI001475565E|nr:class I SAM-dependent methyltransferase [Planctomonas sp. JC2975]NNC11889.1 class I SAM-dependent methyltransferase [Planctomonas sp. JC2975]